MRHSKLVELLESTLSRPASTMPDCANMSAEGIINLIDRRAPDDSQEFDLADIFSAAEIEDLRSNPAIESLKDISDVIHDAVVGLLSNQKESGSSRDDDDDEGEDDYDDTLDAESLKDEGLSKGAKKHDRFFATYKRPRDVSAKIKRDGMYDLKGLISRRRKVIPVDVPFNLSDIFSENELKAMLNHAGFKELSRSLRDDITNALVESLERAALDIEEAIIDAFLSDDNVLSQSLAAESAYRAGFTDSDLKLNELGESHARDLLRGRVNLGTFVLEAADPEGLTNGNDEDMVAAIERIAKAKTKISIRPNLNRRGEITIHKGRLGRKQASVKAVSIKCTDAVVRPSGQGLAQNKGDKTVHAGFIGTVLPEVIMPTASSTPVTYNPHKGDKEFKVNGKTYSGGGVITMVGYKAFKVK